MSTNALLGAGSTVSVHNGDGDPGTWTSLGEVIAIDPPSPSREPVEVTHHGSTAVERIAGFRDDGDGSVTINWVPGDAADVVIQGLMASGETRSWKLVFPRPGGETRVWTFDAFITELTPSAPIKTQMTLAIALQATGPTTQTTE